jgi:flagella synthesis protein FlgN
MNTQIKVLTELLTRECDFVMSLVDILSEEQTCLIKIEADRLLELAVQKETVMHDLDRLFQLRTKACKQCGYADGLSGMELWMDTVAGMDLNIRCLLDNFKTSLKQAQRLNNLNGTLVSEQLSTLQQRISLMQKARDHSAPSTYGPDGTFGSSSPFTQRAAIR